MLAITVSVLSVLSLVALFIFFLVYSLDFFTTLKSPFLPVSKKIIPRIIETLDLKDDSIVYDLGCGDARVLVECYKHNSRARYIGIEKSIIPYTLARISARNMNKIKILRNDLFKENLLPATHVFVYLLPKMMDRLLPKLTRELKQGSNLVSFNFVFSKKKPEKRIEITQPDSKQKMVLYVYNF